MTALTSQDSMLRLLATWADAGCIRDLDYAFARTLAARAPDTPPLALLAAALVSHQVGQGHLLLDLEHALRDPDSIVAAPAFETSRSAPPSLADVLAGVDSASWRKALVSSSITQADAVRSPLVVSGHAVYLRRFWDHERRIERAIETRLLHPADPDTSRLRHVLDALFPASQRPSDGADWQQIACTLAARQRFAVITGGPGTGKTTTVIKLLALLQALALDDGAGRPLRVALAAPTGKAAARLNASIAGQVAALDLSNLARGEVVRAAIPDEVATLHRLLGARGDGRFHFHADRLLPLDAVVVDEASMIDEALMAALLDALPTHARLVLLGDKDQLASVEAGAIMASLCVRADAGHYTPQTRDWLIDVTGVTLDDTLVDPGGRNLDQAIAMLRYSHRFGPESGIGRLARAINAGAADTVMALLDDPALGDIRRLRPDTDDASTLLQWILDGIDGAPGYRACLETIEQVRPAPGAGQDAFDMWAARVLAAQSRFQLLCAIHDGPQGRRALNIRIEAELARRGYIDRGPPEGPNPWYEGRPVIVTANDYNLDLRNGDVGITLRVADSRDDGAPALRVAFPRGDMSQGVRWVLPSRLAHCETVYAMTVHKAQGSEFDHVALVMPERASPVVTRELLYTAVTRAKGRMSLLAAAPEQIAAAVERTVERASGLFRGSP